MREEVTPWVGGFSVTISVNRVLGGEVSALHLEW